MRDKTPGHPIAKDDGLGSIGARHHNAQTARGVPYDPTRLLEELVPLVGLNRKERSKEDLLFDPDTDYDIIPIEDTLAKSILLILFPSLFIVFLAII